MHDQTQKTKESIRKILAKWQEKSAKWEKERKERRLQRMNDLMRAKQEAASLEKRISFLENCIAEINKKLRSR